MKFRIPDWLIYAIIVFLIYLNSTQATKDDIPAEQAPPPRLGELLPVETPRDPTVLVDVETVSSGLGTAFVIDNKGNWVTARHVVDGCDKVALQLGPLKILRVDVKVSKTSDTALLQAPWRRKPIPTDLYSQRQIGEHGFFFGFPQGQPGEVIGALLSRHRLISRGRYNTEEAILAWTEMGRTWGLKGSLGGLSGAPVLDKDGEVIGVVSAESPRRGRIYSVAPRNLKTITPANLEVKAEPIDYNRYGNHADAYRRERRIAQVVCVVR